MKFHMDLNAANIFYKNDNYSFRRKLMIGLVGYVFKFYGMFQNIQIINGDNLLSVIESRHCKRPLLTFANHDSLGDDNLLWGYLLPKNNLLKVDKVRWSLAATDFCFTNSFFSSVLFYGQTLPIWRSIHCRETGKIVTRGAGIMQPTMQFLLDKLNQCQWIHIYPQSRIIYGFEKLREQQVRLRQGIGRLIYDCDKNPIIIPIWHCGLESVVPRLTYGAKATICVGDPIDIPREYLRDSTNPDANNDAQRLEMIQHITETVQNAFYDLRLVARQHHLNFIS